MRVQALLDTYSIRIVDDNCRVSLINEKTREVESVEVGTAKDKAMLAYSYLTEKGVSIMSQTVSSKGGLVFHALDTEEPEHVIINYTERIALEQALEAIGNSDRTARLWDGQSNLVISFDRLTCKEIHLRFHDLDDEEDIPLDRGLSWELIKDLMVEGETLFQLLFDISAKLNLEIWFADESTALRSYYRYKG